MTDRRRYLVITALLAIAIVVVGLLAFPGSPIQRKPTLGLDLQGGLEVVLKAKPPENRPNYKITAADLDRSVSIMRNRIDKLGVSEPEIRKQGADQIVIQLAGVTDPQKAADLIGQTAQLQFYDLEADIAPPTKTANGQVSPKSSLYILLAPVQSQINDKSNHWYLFKKKKKVAGPATSRESLLSGVSIKGIPKKPGAKLPKGYKIFGVPSDRIVITCGTSTVVCPGVGTPTRTYFYLFNYEPTAKNPIPEMTGDDLKLSGTQADFDQQTSQPIVLMQFTGQGAKIFQEITAKEAQRGKLAYQFAGNQGDPQNYFQSFAIVLDNEIKSFPTIDFTQYPNGISGSNGAQITGLAGIDEAKQLALVLQSGALPVQFVTKAETQVSATLGKDSLSQAKKAAAIGLLVVALFLLLFYRFLGLVAVIGLAIYAAFMYAGILLFHVTLTLPGFAGLILTIGVAADANVVIFERIKEEVRSGKSVRHAIATGYSRGFHTIIDANVVTAITAMVLFAVAVAQVKGFALMLLIGTVMSMITAVAATRALLGLLASFRWFDNPRFMGATATEVPRWQRIDINSRKKRRIWLSLATVAIGLSIVALAVKGLNLGIDFKGGTQTTFTTPTPTSLGDVRTEAGRVGQSGAVVQGQGKLFGSDSYKEFQVRTKPLPQSKQATFVRDLETKLHATVRGATAVSSSFSREIAKGAILAVIVSFALLMVYITLRFQWRFAIPILRTLFSDILITLGVYSLSGREVSTATVAAVLTVLGYSIYDTIIVFDRVRENIPLMRRASFATIANVSLWETVRRSLATTFITLLPIGALLIFGGATLKDFAFALFIGIGLGAVSTFFVATPFLTVLMERHPDFKRRVGLDDVAEAGVGGAAVMAAPVEAPEPAEAEEEPTEPELVPTAPAGDPGKAEERRQRRQQRRRTRPHGRAR
ncbi:MAG: protein translocase subunit SecD [Actinobacteria bacterium]|nr:protein translocase subunit SecD [Actinomycetota bacterium]